MGANKKEFGWIRKKKEKKRKRDKERERAEEREREKGKRGFRFFLRSTKIGQSVFVEARGKVHLRDKSFTWVRESGVFAKL